MSVRDIRNHGGEVIDRAAAGEHIVITRSGRPVAELRPLHGAVLAEELISRRVGLPVVDDRALRDDVDAAVDQRL
ncbi:MAG: hypothetical protein NVSMB16_05840 [Acidimicrobiales bacterium]